MMAAPRTSPGFPCLVFVLIMTATLAVNAPAPVFRLASYYGDHMVLQMEPYQSIVWGYGEKNADIELMLKGRVYSTYTSQGPETDWIWKVTLDVMPPSGPFDIQINHRSISNITQAIILRDVLFGDVWLCSGQSNMQFTVNEAFNASLELLEAYKYPHIRLFTADLVESKRTFYDLESVLEPWSVPSPDTVGHGPRIYFSAVCWFYARNIYNHFKYPIGLIASSWGGTPIEAWSSPDSLKKCNITEEKITKSYLTANSGKRTPRTFSVSNTIVDSEYKYQRKLPNGTSNRLSFKIDEGFEKHGPAGHSVLWNSMIHPFLNLTIKGVLWYQGESNAVAPDSYSCTFPAMIEDWRRKFHVGSDMQTDKQFPFGFVQISISQGDPSVITGWPTIRWHQTADYGYVPNEKMPNVFMAVAMDLGDPQSPAGAQHPRYKQDVGYRLALAGRAIAYKESSVKYNGPFPTNITVWSLGSTIDIVYDDAKTEIELKHNTGFESAVRPHQTVRLCLLTG
ncbi:sialate O-acetylesterase-like isoform X2 [Glandiceps talaboti]